MLRRSILVVLIVTPLLLWAPGGSVSAQETVTVQGEIIDMACYMAKGKKGPEHKSCALLCAKSGVPIGVLTDAGEVYLLLDDHDNSDPYEDAKKLAGSRAEITGTKFVKPGVASIVVSSAKGL